MESFQVVFSCRACRQGLGRRGSRARRRGRGTGRGGAVPRGRPIGSRGGGSACSERDGRRRRAGVKAEAGRGGAAGAAGREGGSAARRGATGPAGAEELASRRKPRPKFFFVFGSFFSLFDGGRRRKGNAGRNTEAGLGLSTVFLGSRDLKVNVKSNLSHLQSQVML